MLESVGPRISLSVFFAKGRLGYKRSTSFQCFVFIFPMLDSAGIKSLPFSV